jgi:hypothetical protein
VDSICSEIVIGTAGLSLFCGSEPVMATVMMQAALDRGCDVCSPSLIRLLPACSVTTGFSDY